MPVPAARCRAAGVGDHAYDVACVENRVKSMMLADRFATNAGRLQRHNVIQHSDDACRSCERAYRALVAHGAGPSSHSRRVGRELVPAWAAKRKCTGHKSPALGLLYGAGGRVVRGAFDMARS